MMILSTRLQEQTTAPSAALICQLCQHISALGGAPAGRAARVSVRILIVAVVQYLDERGHVQFQAYSKDTSAVQLVAQKGDGTGRPNTQAGCYTSP